MKLIIDIPDGAYKDILKTNTIKGYLGSVDWSIRNGKPYEEKPQGEWIATQVIGISEITLTCTNCKDEFVGENDIDTWKSVYHYCPSCGAYMGADMRKGDAE